jgi:hypothetical protein
MLRVKHCQKRKSFSLWLGCCGLYDRRLLNHFPLNQHDFLYLISIQHLVLPVHPNHHRGHRDRNHITLQHRAVAQFHIIAREASQFERDTAARSFVRFDINWRCARSIPFLTEREGMPADWHVNRYRSDTYIMPVHLEGSSWRHRFDFQRNGPEGDGVPSRIGLSRQAQCDRKPN